MKILIITIKNDVHTDIVIWGLKILGYEPEIWLWDEFPKEDQISWQFNANGRPTVEIQSHQKIFSTPFDVIWNRRHGQPTPSPASHPADVKTIVTEARAYIKNIFHFLEDEKTFWVNSPTAASRANDKVLQLQIAKKVGFKTPETLITNNPDKVRDFFKQQQEEVIFKAFLPNVWNESTEKVFASRTSELTKEHLLNDFSIRACPGIFQNKIKKAYEVRVTVMGEKVIAAAIYSSRDGETVDFRYDLNQGDFPLKAVKLPSEIEKKCLALCRKLGLAFGCIDLIYSKAGEYIFLEINEAGQFLWKETIDPSLLLLDTFCKFISRNRGIKQAHDSITLHIKDWLDSDSYKETKSKRQLF
jgi:glutathione synthase/RimK-type ligase-like ATP-grasp enzyme